MNEETGYRVTNPFCMYTHSISMHLFILLASSMYFFLV